MIVNLENWCRRLVDLKYFLDDKREAERKLDKKDFKTNVHSMSPTQFAMDVLPFWKLAPKSISQTLHIDPSLVIGATYKIYDDYSFARCEQINNNISDTAHYEKIGDLPLYIATEGKNRVRLFQQHQSHIKVRVTVLAYPSADELLLRKLAFNNNYYLTCSNKSFDSYDRHTVLLLYPEITVPLFKSYGVREGNSFKNPFKLTDDRLLSQKILESKSLS